MLSLAQSNCLTYNTFQLYNTLLIKHHTKTNYLIFDFDDCMKPMSSRATDLIHRTRIDAMTNKIKIFQKILS